jgi:hypothetical protein
MPNDSADRAGGKPLGLGAGRASAHIIAAGDCFPTSVPAETVPASPQVPPPDGKEKSGSCPDREQAIHVAKQFIDRRLYRQKLLASARLDSLEEQCQF